MNDVRGWGGSTSENQSKTAVPILFSSDPKLKGTNVMRLATGGFLSAVLWAEALGHWFRATRQNTYRGGEHSRGRRAIF